MSKKLFIQTKEYFCFECNIFEWNGQPLCLEIDHIDGNNQNNDITNLRYLCPNCHSQTSTWRGRNIKKPYISDEIFLSTLKESQSIKEALEKLNLTPKGANYKRAHELLNTIYRTIDIKNSQFNTIWVNNSFSNKKLKKEELEYYLKLGWQLGRIRTWKMPPSNKNKFWVTNGIVNKMVIDDIPEGFWRGKVQKQK